MVISFIYCTVFNSIFPLLEGLMDNMKDSIIRQEYIARINYVQDYIGKNIGDSLTLEELSMVSGFSKYHFHRIFSSIVNESLYKYINRLRLEKAASYLIHKPQKPITEIALKFGFTNSAVFSRSFKKILWHECHRV